MWMRSGQEEEMWYTYSFTIVIAFLAFCFQAEDGIRDYKVMEFRRVLFRSGLPPAPDVATVFAEIAEQARAAVPAKRMFMNALADVLTLRESEAGTAPFDDLKLCRAWLTDRKSVG